MYCSSHTGVGFSHSEKYFLIFIETSIIFKNTLLLLIYLYIIRPLQWFLVRSLHVNKLNSRRVMLNFCFVAYRVWTMAGLNAYFHKIKLCLLLLPQVLGF